MKKVYVAQHPPEAHLVKGFLESQGIVAVVHGENLFSIRGGVPLTPETSASVWVADADFEQADELVKEFFRETEAERHGENWHCHVCGEILEAQFTDCWNCGASRNLSADLSAS